MLLPNGFNSFKMRYFKFIALVCFYFIFLGQALSQGLQKSTIEVKDSQSGLGLSNVSIQWKGLSNSRAGGGVTNSIGVALLDIKTDTVILTVSCIGYKSFIDTVAVKPLISVDLSEDIFNLDQVIVTGTRTPRSLKETPVLTQLITCKDISSIRAATINDVLEIEIPSVELNRHGFGASLSSQGLDSKYTLILIDGERMAGESDGNVDLSRINAANIDRVEVVKGASSALYGSNAMGSVINIITKKPNKALDISVNIRYAQPNEKNTSKAQIDLLDEQYLKKFYRNQDRQNINGDFSVGLNRTNFFSQSYFGYKSSDAYQLFDSKETVRYYPTLDSTAYDGVNQIPSYIFGFEDYTVTNRTGLCVKNWNAELRGSYYSHEEFDFSRNSTHNLYRDYTLGGFLERKLSDSASVKLSYNYDAYSKYSVLEKLGSNELNYINTFNHIKATYTGIPFRNHRIFFGAELLHEYMESDRFIALSMVDHSVYDAVLVLQDEYTLWPRVTLVGGIRGGFQSVFGSHVSPLATVKVSVGRVNYRVSYAKGFKSPSLKELYMDWDHQGMFAIIGNKDLMPETNNYYALSADYVNTQKYLNITSTVAINDIHDKIGGVWTANQTEYHYKNMNDYRILNAELQLRWKFIDDFYLKVGYVYTKVLEKESIARLSETSPHSFTGELEYSYRKGWYGLTTNLSVKAIGRKDMSVLDEDINVYYYISYSAYSLWNVAVNQKFGSNFSVNIGVKNIFNYTAPIVGFNTTSSVGRRFYISMGYDF